ncbi:hypothetical protein Kpol_1041p43 [Vanderwaltozyma polyspora DSM 70294]|uniref:MIF4G domain-containing protein n=1 Tax=Vanderwaltozyma polyspora (strain ATCC 22028 / DSM 70294 / BCRC 21397 / CBS 2163 / NBRC 10782 / NRRL Y-8283 / UCD 57-17) TaxID=436907 RepID=A7TLB0_VANPO|nr:uncharacterized protein Kpol_1041p43 [Vanderwaltozyma polyspora DSM 70294]EDO16985.1 hypothetical protein Kpol_1041p43 [Vanderwaltozyma polyspora DSM 70294]
MSAEKKPHTLQPQERQQSIDEQNGYSHANNYHVNHNKYQQRQNYNKQNYHRNVRYNNNGNNNNNNNNGNGKYNNYNQNSQYGRYNNGLMNRGYNNGYKNHRGGMQPIVHMQWPGYAMAQPMYYMPQEMNIQHSPAAIDLPSTTSSTTSSSKSGNYSPAGKRIEITTKNGEQLDLKAIHTKYLADSNQEQSSKENTPGEEEPKSDEQPESEENSEESLSEAEKTRKLFLEQIKLRKAALEKKKNESDLQSDTNEEISTNVEVPEDENSNDTIPPVEHETQYLKDNEKEVNDNEKATQENPLDNANEVNKELDSTDVETKDDKSNDCSTDVHDNNSMTVSNLLEILQRAKPIEDIYSFEYPKGFEKPDSKYSRSNIKYTYGPTFLLQFKDKIKVKPDTKWIDEALSKIVIPPGMTRIDRVRDGKFGMGSRLSSNRDFSKTGSMRNMDGRSNSRNNSKRKSKRGGMEDRRSTRAYTSRKERERMAEGRLEEEKFTEGKKEEVAPLVPSANRWVPKSRMKKTEKKLAPDGVTELIDEEEAKRKMKSLLNKLTLEKFDTISSEVLALANQSKWESNGETLIIVIEELFHKACDEPHWTVMYAQLCGKIVKELDPEIKDENNPTKTGPKLVLHYLVARCHTEFEKGWSDKLPTNPDGSPLEIEMMSEEYYQAAAAKRRGLGLVRFIGFLYRLNLLTGKMMFECFRRLMKDLNDNPTEETLESVIELLSTVGEQFETDSFSAGQATLEGSALLDSLFGIIQKIIDSGKISSRIKFKLIDLKELREDKNWTGVKKDEGPKTISQIHEEDERQRKLKELKNSSRGGSRRMNSNFHSNNNSHNNSGVGGGRMLSRREQPAVSKDNFITTRSTSSRMNQKVSYKEETVPEPQPTVVSNMFNALMNHDDDDD